MKMPPIRLCAALAAMLLAASVGQSPAQMPRVADESLAGHKVELPEAARGHIAVLIFGFTPASNAPTSAGAERLRSDFGDPTGLRFINCQFWRMCRESSVGW